MPVDRQLGGHREPRVGGRVDGARGHAPEQLERLVFASEGAQGAPPGDSPCPVRGVTPAIRDVNFLEIVALHVVGCGHPPPVAGTVSLEAIPDLGIEVGIDVTQHLPGGPRLVGVLQRKRVLSLRHERPWVGLETFPQ